VKARAKFSRWDAADYLRSEADMAAYLEAVLDEAPDDAALFVAALGNIARARGMVQLAKDTGISREGLYKALSPEGNPSLGTVLKVVRALHLKLTPQAAGTAGARRDLAEAPTRARRASSRKREVCPA